MSFQIGDAVVYTHHEEQRIGEVLAAITLGPLTLYDVTFERERIHALLESELEQASETQMRAVAAGMALEDSAAQGHAMPPTPETIRDQWLRQRYLAWLSEAIERVRQGATTVASGRFAPADTVVVSIGDAWCLGCVARVVREPAGIAYDVEIEGELEHHAEDALSTPYEANVPGRLALGDRVRLASSGHAGDPDFEGTLCRVEVEGDALTYALAFDDGDIFWGLGEADLVLLGE